MFEFDSIEQNSTEQQEGFFNADYSADLDSMKNEWLSYWENKRNIQRHNFSESIENTIETASFEYTTSDENALAIKLDMFIDGSMEKYVAVYFHKFLSDNFIKTIYGKVEQRDINCEYSLATNTEYISEYSIGVSPNQNSNIKLPPFVDVCNIETTNYNYFGQNVICVRYNGENLDYKKTQIKNLILDVTNSTCFRFANIHVKSCLLKIHQHTMCHLSYVFELDKQENLYIESLIVGFKKHHKTYGLGTKSLIQDPYILTINNFNMIAKNRLCAEDADEVQFVINDLDLARKNILNIKDTFSFDVGKLSINKKMINVIFHWMTIPNNPLVKVINGSIYTFTFNDKNWPLSID